MARSAIRFFPLEKEDAVAFTLLLPEGYYTIGDYKVLISCHRTSQHDWADFGQPIRPYGDHLLPSGIMPNLRKEKGNGSIPTLVHDCYIASAHASMPWMIENSKVKILETLPSFFNSHHQNEPDTTLSSRPRES